MMLKRKLIWIGVLIFLNGLLTSCTRETKEEVKTEKISYGKGYYEEEITLPENVVHIQDICVKKDGTLMMAGSDITQKYGAMWELNDGTWNEKVSYIDLIKDRLSENYSVSTAISDEEEVAIIVETDENVSFYFIDRAQELIELKELSNLENTAGLQMDFAPNGNLMLVSPTQIYLINKENGKIQQEYLDGKSVINAYDYIDEGICVIYDGKLVCFNYDSGSEIYPDDMGEIANHVKELNIMGNSNLKFSKVDGKTSALCYLDVYDSEYPGIVKVTSKENEGLIDGSRTYYGHYDYYLSKLETDNKGNVYSVFWGEPEKLMKYTYDPNKMTEDNSQLKVYSLRDSRVVRQNILVYQQENPNVDIVYEIGISEDAERTEQDAMKSLNTEIAAGTGPDIIIMDDLRIDDYIRQGILEDVSNVIEETEKSEELVEAVVNTFKEQGKVFAIPMRFSYMTVENQKSEGELGSYQDFEQLTNEVFELNTEKYSLFDPFSFDHILTISYWSYFRDFLEKEDVENVDNLQERLDQYYSLVKMWYDKVDMTEASEKDMTNFSLNPYAYRDYEGSEMMGQPLVSLDYITNEWDFQYLLNNKEINYTLLKNENEILYVPACIAGINAKSKEIEEAKKFLLFMLGKDGQLTEQYRGMKVNKEAIKTILTDDKLQRFSSIERGFSEEEKETILGSVEQLSRSVDTDSVFMRIVLEGMSGVLDEEITSSEAAENAAKKINLYLLE